MQLQRFAPWVIAVAVGAFAVFAGRRVFDRRANGVVPPVTDVEPNDDTAPSNAAPPPLPLRVPPAPLAPGSVWQEGEWHYASGHWTWTEGHWEKARPGFVLIQPEWVEANGRWERHAAHWVKDDAEEDDAQRVLRPPG